MESFMKRAVELAVENVREGGEHCPMCIYMSGIRKGYYRASIDDAAEIVWIYQR